jgi:hypothetical protein
MTDASTIPTYVLTVEAVKWSIRELQRTRIHPHFLAYLQLRRRAQDTALGEAIEPRWSELRPLLVLPGGPPKKPNYRPLWNNVDNDGSVYWFNDNLAGSYATSSIRNTAGFLVRDKSFVLPSDHAEQALAALLYGSKASAVALGAYFLRNYGFRTPHVFPDDGEVIEGFRKWFRFESSTEFSLLFDTDQVTVDFDWFEPAPQEGSHGG